MASPLLESLRGALTAMPPGALVPRDWLLEQLGDVSPDAPTPVVPAPPAPGDVTMRGLAQLFGKQPSTAAAWGEGGEFTRACKLHGKGSGVPRSPGEAFQYRQRR